MNICGTTISLTLIRSPLFRREDRSWQVNRRFAVRHLEHPQMFQEPSVLGPGKLFLNHRMVRLMKLEQACGSNRSMYRSGDCCLRSVSFRCVGGAPLQQHEVGSSSLGFRVLAVSLVRVVAADGYPGCFQNPYSTITLYVQLAVQSSLDAVLLLNVGCRRSQHREFQDGT